MLIAMSRIVLIALLFALPVYAADVHVRVDPAVKTGILGTTEFPTIQNALDHHPLATPNADGTAGRVFIEIAPGVYHERLIVTQNHENVTLIGKGNSPDAVVITNSLNAKQAGGTFLTSTVDIEATGFEADNITFENSAGNTGQAVAVSNRGDRTIFKHCRFLGYQDTLYADYGRQYYVDSYIEGGVDFIFGNAAAVFDRDEIHSNGPGYLTAQSRTDDRLCDSEQPRHGYARSRRAQDDLPRASVASVCPCCLYPHRASCGDRSCGLGQVEAGRSSTRGLLRRVWDDRPRRIARDARRVVASTHACRGGKVSSRSFSGWSRPLERSRRSRKTAVAYLKIAIYKIVCHSVAKRRNLLLLAPRRYTPTEIPKSPHLRVRDGGFG